MKEVKTYLLLMKVCFKGYVLAEILAVMIISGILIISVFTCISNMNHAAVWFLKQCHEEVQLITLCHDVGVDFRDSGMLYYKNDSLCCFRRDGLVSVYQIDSNMINGIRNGLHTKYQVRIKEIGSRSNNDPDSAGYPEKVWLVFDLNGIEYRFFFRIFPDMTEKTEFYLMQKGLLQ